MNIIFNHVNFTVVPFRVPCMGQIELFIYLAEYKYVLALNNLE